MCFIGSLCNRAAQSNWIMKRKVKKVFTTSIHPYLIPASSKQGRGGAGTCLQAKGMVHPGQVACPSQGNSHVFGLQEEAGEPTHAQENMRTPCRKIPSRESNPGPVCCKATVQPP
ncbi:hypothetical protein ATANTOWER_016620 [Ataeniobius toweri]|uniref:Uncharacterized protein n=1 Tax=Ataeniobius toweri TaxID=208326 RepID=A0ABU7BGQ3_9TELE|nr:hypothetical protein [Ataeniobius toweri]